MMQRNLTDMLSITKSLTFFYLLSLAFPFSSSAILSSEGSTMCEVEKGVTTAKEVYGYVDSIRLEWDTVPSDVDDNVPEEAVMMSMEGRPSCVRPLFIMMASQQVRLCRKPFWITSKLRCPLLKKTRAERRRLTSIVRIFSPLTSCSLFLSFSLSLRKAINPTTPAITKIYFTCDELGDKEPSLLVESEYGCYVEILFPTPHVCDSPPQPQKYACENNKCIFDPSGSTLAECQGSCGSEKMYTCDKDACVEVPTGGKGVAKELCDSICGGGKPPPSPPATDLYKCHEGKCEAVPAGGKGVTKAQCEQVCDAPPPPPPPPTGTKYRCHEAKCEIATDGKGVTKEQCDQVCGKSKAAFAVK